VKVLFICDSFLPHAGGARVYYWNLYKNLALARGADVTVLTKKVPGWQDFDRVESGDHLRIVRCGTPLESWKYHEWPRILVPLLRAVPLLARQQFDLIHFGDLYPPGVLSLFFKRVLKKPYVAYCHGEEITQTDLRRYQPRVRNAVFREAEVVVAANEFARQNLLRIGISDERICKITPGVDCDRFQPEEPREELIERHGLRGRTVILTVARLVPRKGHQTVLEAIRRLLPEIPNLTYLIVGTGPEQEQLKKTAAEWNLTSAVRFAGFVEDADLPAYYNLCDLFVMPNFEEQGTGDIEGFGMVFLEANACGKTVVAGRSGGTSEAVLHGTTGMLVSPQDPAELTEVLRLLIGHDTLRKKLAENGLRRARSEFSWVSRANMLEQIDRDIVAKGPARRQHYGNAAFRNR
jgi:phosphatidylinositol alpha-1,6-mannosyltransferase